MAGRDGATGRERRDQSGRRPVERGGKQCRQYGTGPEGCPRWRPGSLPADDPWAETSSLAKVHKVVGTRFSGHGVWPLPAYG